MTRGAEFQRAVRHGQRAGRSRLVTHAYRDRSGSDSASPPARVGFVVGRNVGGSVVRHRVQRRLRHLVADRLDRLAPGTLLVVRAMPPAAAATSIELAGDLDATLRRMATTVDGAA